jgi:hypothetical protein
MSIKIHESINKNTQAILKKYMYPALYKKKNLFKALFEEVLQI